MGQAVREHGGEGGGVKLIVEIPDEWFRQMEKAGCDAGTVAAEVKAHLQWFGVPSEVTPVKEAT